MQFEDGEEPFEIPDNWRWTTIGQIADCGSGSTPLRSQSKYWTNGEINWLKTGELNNGEIYSSEEKISQLALKECSLRMCKENDVLIAMYGATIGKLGIAKVPLTTNQACCACTMFGKLNYKYFFYYLMAIKDVLIGKAEGGAQPNISREKIVAQHIPIPPLEEQNRIVAKLEQILPLIYDLS